MIARLHHLRELQRKQVNTKEHHDYLHHPSFCHKCRIAV